MSSIENNIIFAHSNHDNEQIRKIYIDLLNTRSKLDRWFNKYLDMFDEKFSDYSEKDPVKKLYNSKYEEYSKLNNTIKLAEFYLNNE